MLISGIGVAHAMLAQEAGERRRHPLCLPLQSQAVKATPEAISQHAVDHEVDLRPRCRCAF
jgi:hypothetical protein